MAKQTKKRAIIYSNVKENKKLAEERAKIKNDQINLNDEVIIGFNSSKNSDGKTKQSKRKSSSSNKKQNVPPKKSSSKPNKKNAKKMNPKKKRKIISGVVLFLITIIVIIGGLVFLKSPIFNIKEISIVVENNAILTEADIRDLSNISIGENMFSMNKKVATDRIKSNPYIEDVKIKRIIPNKIEIAAIERNVKFQFECEDNYIYIDEKGIPLELSNEKKDCILVTGYKTGNIQFGKILDDDDLRGLSAVILILQEAEKNNIGTKISKIDISNHNDYLVYFDDEAKIAHIGNANSINDKISRIKKIMEVEAAYPGDIFVNVNLNKGEYPYFRERV